jgi:hypothetical protein
MLEQRSPSTIDRDLAGRLALTLADLPGVTGALISSLEGDVLGDSGVADAARSAALATFVAHRADNLSLDGDLRGMGRLLASSQLDHVAISGDPGDAVVLAPGSCFVFLTLQRAYPVASVATPALLLLRRYL